MRIKYLQNYFLLFTLCLGSINLSAQSPNDAIMMPRKNLCTLVQYTHSAWDTYWEGPNRRTNANLGTVTTQNVMLMFNYGITSRLNVMAAIPYVWTKTSASYLSPQDGVQDLSIFAKYQLLEKSVLGGKFKIQATGGLSTPVTDYVPDFQPLSIGSGANTASARAILNFTHQTGLYTTIQGGHTWRSNITVDRESFLLHDILYYGNEVPVPNVFDASVRLGYIKPKFQAEIWTDYFTGLSGDDIRYNDAPFPTNKMSANSVGAYAKYYFGRLGIQASYNQVYAGRNAGKSTTISGGISYFFHVGKKPAVN